ncbi:glycosyltransferase family 2 protein [Patescibacteria group bacterium]|nr:glycosyltransferase family 2 protein [Patescibacteria group bacterium]MBU1970529.1 glycosyltransferase family 2 protein [Patescibacteria group bacterium]
MDAIKKISIVIPCYNEEKNINRTLEGLVALLKNDSKLTCYQSQIIAVDDGSKDGTWKVIAQYAQKEPIVKGIRLMGNFGQSCAYQAGFDASNGDYVITVSADMEIPLENVVKVVELLEHGYDFVNTNRRNRWGGEKKAKSGLANKIISKISGISMQDRGSGMKGFSRIIVNNLKLYGDMHRFIPDYLTVYRAKMVEFEVDFKDRDFGVSAYKGSKRTVQVLLDIITLAFMLKFARKPFTLAPGRFFGFTGAVITGLGGLGMVYLIILKLLGYSIGDRPLLIASVLMVVVGVQLVMTGLLGELMTRVYFESANRKTYAVRETA